MREKLAEEINELVFGKLKRERRISTFLVGASSTNRGSLRDMLRKELETWQYFYWLDIYYPEDLFEDLLKTSSKYELLSLENLLAESVHAIVLILESPGAIAELGAFSNHQLLKDKLIVVVDERHKKARSFIRLGPLRYLDKHTKSTIIFHDLKRPNVKELAKLLRSDLRRMAKEGPSPEPSVANPIEARHFLLVSAYVLERVDRAALFSSLRSVLTKSHERADSIFTCAFNILLREKEVELVGNGKYELTQKGRRKLLDTARLRTDSPEASSALDALRVASINSSLRGSDYRSRRRREGVGRS